MYISMHLCICACTHVCICVHSSTVGTFRDTTGAVRSRSYNKVKVKGQPRARKLECHQARGNDGEFD